MGLFARLTGWNPRGLPRSHPRQRRKTRRGPPDPPQRSPEPPLRKSSQGTKAPALQIPWFLCRPCRDKGTTTWHDEPDLDPVVPLWRSARQGNHDPRISPRSPSRGSFVAPEATKEPRPAKPPTLLIPWFLSSAQRDKGTTTWGARGAFVPLELWRGAFVLLELLAHGSWRGLGAWEATRGEGWGVPLHVLRRWRGKDLGAAGGDPASQASEEGHPTPPRPTPSLAPPHLATFAPDLPGSQSER